MSRLESYLLSEDRSKELSFDEAKNILETKCQKALNSPSNIYRGVEKVTDHYLVTPSNTEYRESANTANYYTLIINNDPIWKKFPKRQIICSTNKEISNSYGSIYHVFPFDGAKIGICSEGDIWHSFGYSMNVRRFHRELIKLIGEPSSYSILKKKLQSIKVADLDWNKIKVDYISEIQWVIRETEKTYNTMWDFIIDIYSPTNFGVVRVGSKLPHNREVWTDAPCLLINDYKMDEFLND